MQYTALSAVALENSTPEVLEFESEDKDSEDIGLSPYVTLIDSKEPEGEIIK